MQRQSLVLQLLLIAVPHAVGQTCPPTNLAFVSDGKQFKISQDCLFETSAPAVERLLDPATFYSYSSASAHTGFEVKDRSLLFLYRDLGNPTELALYWINGIDNHQNCNTGVGPCTETGDRNYGTVASEQEEQQVACVWGMISGDQPDSLGGMNGLPAGTTIDAADDSAQEFGWHNKLDYVDALPSSNAIGAEPPNTPFIAGRWGYAKNTDGGTVGSLPINKNWCVRVDVDFDDPGMNSHGIGGGGGACKGVMNDWRFFFADGTNQVLDPSKPVWLCNEGGCGCTPCTDLGVPTTYCGLAVDTSPGNSMGDIEYTFDFGDGSPPVTKKCKSNQNDPNVALCCVTHTRTSEGACSVSVSAKQTLCPASTPTPNHLNPIASSSCVCTSTVTNSPSVAARGCLSPPMPPPMPPASPAQVTPKPWWFTPVPTPAPPATTTTTTTTTAGAVPSVSPSAATATGPTTTTGTAPTTGSATTGTGTTGTSATTTTATTAAQTTATNAAAIGGSSSGSGVILTQPPSATSGAAFAGTTQVGVADPVNTDRCTGITSEGVCASDVDCTWDPVSMRCSAVIGNQDKDESLEPKYIALIASAAGTCCLCTLVGAVYAMRSRPVQSAKQPSPAPGPQGGKGPAQTPGGKLGAKGKGPLIETGRNTPTFGKGKGGTPRGGSSPIRGPQGSFSAAGNSPRRVGAGRHGSNPSFHRAATGVSEGAIPGRTTPPRRIASHQDFSVSKHGDVPYADV